MDTPVISQYQSVTEAWRDFCCFIKVNQTKFILFVSGFVLLLANIGIQNVPFWDDSMRRLTGFTAWGPWDGRWGSEWVGRALNAGRPIVDIGVTSFLITGLIMALACAMIIWALVGRSANWITWLVALSVGLNPWILNALAFRFDGPFMALSVLAAVSSVLFYRSPPLTAFVAYLALTFLTANFFQSSIGLILTLLMTRVLLDWIQGELLPRAAWQRVGIGFGGVALGVIAYAIQARVFGTGRSGWFDLSNPFGAFPNNLFHFIRVFIRDSAPSWLAVMALVMLLAIYGMLRSSRIGVVKPLLVLPLYLVLSVLASGGVLLFATAEHISVQARFRFPLAMGLGFLAIIASILTKNSTPSSNSVPRSNLLPPNNPVTPSNLVSSNDSTSIALAIRWLSRAALLAFAYLWLMVVPMFANVIAEQQNALRTQASLIFSDAFTFYRPGDTILYEPNILTNSIYAERVGQRFPIFENSTYVGFLNLHNDNIRDRLTEILGLPQGVLRATQEQPGLCDWRDPATTTAVAGPRWEAWRATDEVVCVTFPDFAQIEVNTAAVQEFSLNLNRFPFGTTSAPAPETLRPEDLEVALWSLTDPADIIWEHPVALTEGVARFNVPAPLVGWQGDKVVAHFFLQDEFLFQQIWQIAN